MSLTSAEHEGWARTLSISDGSPIHMYVSLPPHDHSSRVLRPPACSCPGAGWAGQRRDKTGETELEGGPLESSRAGLRGAQSKGKARCGQELPGAQDRDSPPSTFLQRTIKGQLSPDFWLQDCVGNRVRGPGAMRVTHPSSFSLMTPRGRLLSP